MQSANATRAEMTRQERMALALAYQQRRPNLGDLSPEQITAMQAPTQQPTMSLLDRLSETGAGIGKGLANTVEGMGQMVTAPIETGKEMYRNVSDVVSNPSLIVDALKQMGEKATSSPAGFGEVVGENINPRNLLKTLTHPKISAISADAEKSFLLQAKAEKKRLSNLGEELPEINDVYDAMNSDLLIKKAAISSLMPHALAKYSKTLENAANQSNLKLSTTDRSGHYWDLEDQFSDDFASVRWMKDHKQKQGGGFNEALQQQHGESDIDIGFDSDGDLTVRLGQDFKPSKQFQKVIDNLKRQFEGKNIVDLLLGEGKR